MLAEPAASELATTRSLVPIGLMLVTISVLAVVALLHHPVAHGSDAVALLNSLRSQATADRIVHGALSLVYGLLAAAMLVFASRIGVWRFPVLLGSVSFCCGSMLMVLAAITDGFIAPAIVERCAQHSTSCVSDTLSLLAFGAEQVEYMTRFALIAITIAVLSWAGALLRTSSAPRWSGVAALAAGAAQVGAALQSTGRLSPHSLLFALAGQIAWYLIVAALMITGRAPFAGKPVTLKLPPPALS